jgi:hypothetical protein
VKERTIRDNVELTRKEYKSGLAKYKELTGERIDVNRLYLETTEWLAGNLAMSLDNLQSAGDYPNKLNLFNEHYRRLLGNEFINFARDLHNLLDSYQSIPSLFSYRNKISRDTSTMKSGLRLILQHIWWKALDEEVTRQPQLRDRVKHLINPEYIY